MLHHRLMSAQPTTVDWSAETRIQIGDPEGPPWPHLGAFLDGFAAGLRANGARSATVVASEDTIHGNPHGRVRFHFEAPDEQQAESLVDDVFFRAGLEAGVDAVPAEGQPFGWVAWTEVRPAWIR
jgi:uncharacterized protein involved in type VI secretion and phage assembly